MYKKCKCEKFNTFESEYILYNQIRSLIGNVNKYEKFIILKLFLPFVLIRLKKILPTLNFGLFYRLLKGCFLIPTSRLQKIQSQKKCFATFLISYFQYCNVFDFFEKNFTVSKLQSFTLFIMLCSWSESNLFC